MSATDIISAEEWQLLAFFEVEPTKLDADIAWPYNSFEYRKAVGDLRVVFSVAPAYKDFDLTVERNGTKLVELMGLSVLDIRYHDGPGSEWLEILFTNEDRLELRLEPSFSLAGSLHHAGPGLQLRGSVQWP